MNVAFESVKVWGHRLGPVHPFEFFVNDTLVGKLPRGTALVDQTVALPPNFIKMVPPGYGDLKVRVETRLSPFILEDSIKRCLRFPSGCEEADHRCLNDPTKPCGDGTRRIDFRPRPHSWRDYGVGRHTERAGNADLGFEITYSIGEPSAIPVLDESFAPE